MTSLYRDWNSDARAGRRQRAHGIFRTVSIAAMFATSSTSILARDEGIGESPAAKTRALTPESGPRDESNVVVFRLAIDAFPSGSVQLSNGATVSVGDWPTVTVATIPQSSILSTRTPLATCTAVLVGPKVMLTAAHCVDDPFSESPRPATLVVDGRKLVFDCSINPKYLKRDPRVTTPRGSEDYALCLLDDKGVLPASLAALRYDVVDIETAMSPKEPVLMVGYGCSDLKVLHDELTYTKTDGLLRIGDERIDRVPSGTEPDPTYAVIRSLRGKEPALCPGDSGGPLFTGVTVDAPKGVRRVRGVNSKVDLEKVPDGYDVLSYVAATSGAVFPSWVHTWAAMNRTKDPVPQEPVICGVTRKAGELPCLR